MIFISWFGQVKHLPSPRCGVPTDEGCTQPLSSDPMIHLNTTVLFISGLSHLNTRVREGIETHARARVVAQTHTSQEMNTKHSAASSQLKQVLKSQTQ
jgi:hypothetical protein